MNNGQGDQANEDAIRAMVMRIKEASTQGNDPEALEKAIRASVAEMSQAQTPDPSTQQNELSGSAQQRSKAPERTLERNLPSDHSAGKPIKRKPIGSTQYDR